MEFTLAAAEREALLSLARRVIETDGRAELPGGGELDRPHGAFVTLHRHGRLRGCIGRMLPGESLAATVADMARAAAYGDPRFPPVSPQEFPELELEISVLSPMERCGPGDILPGVHGVLLSLGHRTGVFLPQVATEQGWDRERLLTELCGKAGLPPGSWKAPGAELSRFTALVFGER